MRRTGRTRVALAACLIKVVRGGIGVFVVSNESMIQYVNQIIHDWATKGVADADPYPEALRAVDLRRFVIRKGGRWEYEPTGGSLYVVKANVLGRDRCTAYVDHLVMGEK